jgi:hypothetical protein
MTQAKFLLEFLVVPFDPPAKPLRRRGEFGAIDQCLEADIGRQGGQPVLGWLVVVLGRSWDTRQGWAKRLPADMVASCPI